MIRKNVGVLFVSLCALVSLRAELTEEQLKVPLEREPADASKAKIVFIAGSPSNKPGQHEYFAGCSLMSDWLQGVPGVATVMVADGWPKKVELLTGAKCVVLFMDGGDKLPFLSPERWEVMQKLVKAGTGFVVLHQAVDCPADRSADFKQWFGAVFQKDIGCRGHWDVAFDRIESHPINAGMTPFELKKDGWLYNLHFAETGVKPVLSAVMPDSSRSTADAKAHLGRSEAVAWAFERAGGGRSFGFTGCDLHQNWDVAAQRQLLINGILWAAKLPLIEAGAVPALSPGDLAKNWDRKIFQPKKKG
jgi:type 1 glutamine amidotransferase